MIDGYWLPCSSFDPRIVDLYSRHYSSAFNGKGKADWLRSGIAGVGETMALLTVDCTAAYIWIRNRAERYDHQTGVNCTFFRNEGDVLSSDLVREADDLAWQRWTDDLRHFTYVSAEHVRHKRDPGRCFLKAGWQRCGTSKGGLVILERLRKPSAT